MMDYRRPFTPKRRLFGYENDDFGAFFWLVGFDCISFGFHVCWSAPNIEIHLPFGFIRIGWRGDRHVRRWAKRAERAQHMKRLTDMTLNVFFSAPDHGEDWDFDPAWAVEEAVESWEWSQKHPLNFPVR